MPSYSINWDQVSALTRLQHIPKLQDNVFVGSPFLTKVKGRKKAKELGKVLVAPLLVAQEGGGGDWYAGNDQHDTTIRNPITAATFYAKNSIVPIAIDEQEELEATTEAKVLDLLSEKMEAGEQTMRYLLEAALFNSATNPKAMTGLGFALPGANGGNAFIASQTYGGITCGGSAIGSDAAGYWQPNMDSNSGAYYQCGSTGTFMQSPDNPLSKMFATIGLRCGKEPSLLVSNYGLWQDYHNALVKNERYDRPMQDSELAKSGFRSLMYRNAAWITSPLAPHVSTAGATQGLETLYVLDEDAFNVYWDPRRDFFSEPWRKPYNQSTRVMYIKNRLELVFRERRSSGTIQALSLLK